MVAAPRHCPICRRTVPEGEEGVRHRPFCSRRCADIDLGKWLTGSYAIPGAAEESEDEEDGGTPNPEGPPVRH